MLGGMLGLPTGRWDDEAEPGEGAPAVAHWAEAGSVHHVFTHFALTLRLYCAEVGQRSADGMWWPVGEIGDAGLPTLFAKLAARGARSEEHTSELQSLMRISYAVFCLKKK